MSLSSRTMLLLLAMLWLLLPACEDDASKITGQTCVADTECGGGVCFDSSCYQTCTRQEDCAGFARCVRHEDSEGNDVNICEATSDFADCTDDAACVALVTGPCEKVGCDLETGLCAFHALADGEKCQGLEGEPGICSNGECAVDTCSLEAVSDEVCDGIDNDCDGFTDEEDSDDLDEAGFFLFDLPLCKEQRGVCEGAVKPASLCVDGVWQACSAEAFLVHSASYAPDSTDASFDGLDNDCDGGTDEEVILTPGFIAIPAGSFWMGSPEEGELCPDGYTGGGCSGDGTGTMIGEPGQWMKEALHYVELTRAFELMEHEVTQEDWHTLFPDWNPSYFPECGDKCPVEGLSWYDALVYANAKSVFEGKSPCYTLTSPACTYNDSPYGVDEAADCMTATRRGISSAKVALNGVETPYDCYGYRLPTESEWEYAYRAGSVTALYPSDGNDGTITETDREPLDPNLDQIGWYGGNAAAVYGGAYGCSGWFMGATTCGPQAFGGKEANAWGLYDMAGNVWEWCWDVWAAYPSGTVATPARDPVGVTGSSRVSRGGSWDGNASSTRAAIRNGNDPGLHYRTGIRLARSLIETGPKYIDNGDGTVVDTNANLVWQKTPNAMLFPLCAESVEYSQCPEAMRWAENHCENNDDGLPGSGWRLPTISELRSLVNGCDETYWDPVTNTGGGCDVTDDCLADSCVSWGSCDGCLIGDGPGEGGLYIDPLFNNSGSSWFWSSSPNESSPDGAWYIYFGYGQVISGEVGYDRGVRCVRSGP